MSTNLTQAQIAKIPDYVDKYLKIGLDTTTTNKQKAEEAIKEHYALQGYEEPLIVWEPSPKKGAQLAAQIASHPQGNELTAKEVLETLPQVTEEQIRSIASSANYGSFNAYWVAYYNFVADVVEQKPDKILNVVNKITEECGVYWTFTKIVVMTEKPVKIMLKNNKLHCLDGMALQYSDGTGVYAIEGTVGNSLLEIKADLLLQQGSN